MAYDQALAFRVRSHLTGTPLLVEKKMFGGIGFLVQGNMACGVHGDNLIVRLDPQDYQSALSRQHVRLFDMTGKPMKGWIFVLPEGVRTEEELAGWVQVGLEYAGRLPAK